MTSNEFTIACFISSHGFGHAARTCAILNAMAELEPEVRVQLFTEVPEWFFEESLEIPFQLHACKTDVGLVQTSVFDHDLPSTLRELDEYFPLSDAIIDDLANKIKYCRFVLCDVSVLGIAVAKRAGMRSVLFENFGWDWIYESFLNDEPGFSNAIRQISDLYEKVDLRIQTEPLCQRIENLDMVPPVSRKPRRLRQETRDLLGIPDVKKLVLVSRGGNPENFQFIQGLKKYPHIIFLFAGGVPEARREDNLIFLPFKTEFFHPDLVHSADLVIGKAGYSMISEIWASGIPFAYILREGFRESPILDSFLCKKVPSKRILDHEFESGGWIHALDAMLSLTTVKGRSNGALTSARLILS
ncbi:MAG: hypothetical protein HOD72_02555 [Opitutae bacterium]|nr:hypothetical protein [Opitutae bacterium]